MANDMQWPSEEEDFDAVTVNNNLSRRPQPTARMTDDVIAPTRSVAISDNDDSVAGATASESIDSGDTESDRSRDENDDISLSDESTPAEDNHADEQQPSEAPTEPAPAEEAPIETAPQVAPEQAKPEVTAAAVIPAATAAAVAANNKPDSTRKSPAGLARTVLEVVLVAGLLGLGVYAYGVHKDKQDLQSQVTKLNANPQLAVQRQTDELIKNVSQLMSLPQGETPTVANVSDAAKAKQQSNFFAKAENGDRVLMYVKAGEAILYRPSTNKIILVAPLTFNNSTAATSSSATTATPTQATSPTPTTTTKPR